MTKAGLFENATRRRYRFPFKGNINTEDLWDLNVKGLDEIYKTLNKELRESQEDSLLTQSDENTELTEKIEIVKYIVQVKMDEQKAQVDAAQRAETRRKLLEVKADRENRRLEGLSDEEINKMLEDLK